MRKEITMNKTIEINDEALAQDIKRITGMAGEDVQEFLLKELRAAIKDAPVTITVTDPVGKKVSTPLLETINKRELAALYALMNYAAHNQNTRPDTVQARVEAKFRVEHVGLIHRDRFQDAVGYLLDMHLRYDEETA